MYVYTNLWSEEPWFGMQSAFSCQCNSFSSLTLEPKKLNCNNVFKWVTFYANKNHREGDTEALCFSPLKSDYQSLTHLKLLHLRQHSLCYDFCFSLHPPLSLDETLQIREKEKSTLHTAHNLHWGMNNCDPDVRPGGGLKVKAKTNATETVHL